ncbi:hypothetical protein ASG38_11595 [Flavobacterium sp. Leaf359]|uniref:hypothetical protein n=1 Tax=Flavobacterium sp. Leaf359 TaxID=1736351 RepID=UPI0006FEA638|nr:hypothetical protein [Flavobacterium sp. Leaf359]KQS46441.1 hypothetical protein ASG38_11595 [Flavobacterium sp. Leaf359]PZQ92478.1 MAG: hypothetical protein DI548_00840 [Flavobacterium johnsoniae]
MSIKNKIYSLLFVFLIINNSSSQNKEIKKETIYICFDKNNGDEKYSDTETINFYLKDKSVTKSNHKLAFVFDSSGIKKEVNFKDYEKKLISVKQAIQKVNNYLKKIKRPVVAYYYNDYFDKIYIYEKLSDNKGILYKVKWNWSIE